MPESDDLKTFEYANKVDLHMLDVSTNVDHVVAIASEHGFRGIVVQLGKLEKLVAAINKPAFGDINLLPICIIDYPYGSSSTDVRTYSMLSAKEKGAKEVEIVAPYHLIVDRDFRSIFADLQNIMATAKKADIAIKYVIDQNSEYIDDAIRTKLCRLMASAKIPTVSTSLGFFDNNIDHADSVIRMRNIKNKVGCVVKVYTNTSDPNEFALYPKAGADIIGVEWNKAPYLVHAYEAIVDKKI